MGKRVKDMTQAQHLNKLKVDTTYRYENRDKVRACDRASWHRRKGTQAPTRQVTGVQTRARAKGARLGILPPDLRDRLQCIQVGQCPYCRQALGSAPHFDHVTPLVHGGRSTVDNLVLACGYCNTLKATRSLEDFAMMMNDRELPYRVARIIGRCVAACQEDGYC